MNRDDEIEYHKFAPGEEPTVHTASALKSGTNTARDRQANRRL